MRNGESVEDTGSTGKSSGHGTTVPSVRTVGPQSILLPLLPLHTGEWFYYGTGSHCDATAVQSNIYIFL